jgi:hypothetical protein
MRKSIEAQHFENKKFNTPRSAHNGSSVDQSGARHTVRVLDGGRRIELHKMLIIFPAF